MTKFDGGKAMKKFLDGKGTPWKQRVIAMAGHRPMRRVTSFVLLWILLFQPILSVPLLRAETGGATAPEVTKFEPVDTTDLVNLASGDFNYNIPVINIPGPEGGYPLTLNYHSGVQQNEEASWVGLGWNLQPGSIARGVRGYPDDYRGEGISTNYLSNVYETYSLDVPWLGVGVNYTTYKGWGGWVGLCAQGEGQYGPFYFQGSSSLKYHFGGGQKSYWTFSNAGSVTVGTNGVGFKVGLNSDWDSRGGWSWGYSVGVVAGNSNASVGAEYSWNSNTGGGYGLTANFGGVSLGYNGSRNGGGMSVGYGGYSASFAAYSGGGQHTQSVTIPLPFWMSFTYTRSWIDKTETEIAYGYYYHTDSNADPNRVNEWQMESDPSVVPGDSKEHALGAGLHYLPDADGYTVSGQGTGGGLRLTRREDRVYRPRRLHDEWNEASDWPWAGNPQTDPRYAARFVFAGDNSEALAHPEYVGLDQASLSAKVKTPGTDGSSKLTQADFPSDAAEFFLGKTFQKGARMVKERVSSDQSGYQKNRFVGFDIWEEDGKHYLYGEPVWLWNSTSISANKNVIGSGEWFRSKTETPYAYAYAWYLTELKYPDYLDSDGIPGVSEGDKGGWVKFGYAIGSNGYGWHNSPDGQLNDGPVNRIDKLGKDKAGMMYSMQYGSKQLKYLSTIDTATHRALFVTSPRADALEIPARPKVNVGNVSVDQNGGYHLTGNYPYLLGNLGLVLANDKWKTIESSETLIVDDPNDPGNPCAGMSATYRKSEYSEPGMTVSIKGLPIVLKKITLVERSTPKPEIILGETTKWGACRVTNYSSFDAEISLADQFWMNDQGVSGAYAYLRSIWANQILNKPVVSQPGAMSRLDDIYLVEKSTNRLVKQVHFFYSYELAKGSPNTDTTYTDANGVVMNPSGGKLTLKAVQFFGQGGMADGDSTLPPYRFDYGNNPNWGSKYSYDRWGFHKSDGGPWRHRDVNPEDQSAWCLTKVTLPTGGVLQVQYEPKDYARVQDRAPLNPRANQGAVSNYMVDLTPWESDSPWPKTDAEWAAFKAKLLTTPLHMFPAGGTADATVGKVTSTLATTAIPIQSAPNPRDLKLWLKLKSQAYATKVSQSPIAVAEEPTGLSGVTIPDKGTGAVQTPQQAVQTELTAPVAVERMVNLVFEYWTAGARAQKRLKRPLKSLDATDIGGEGDDDRGDTLIQSTLVRMKRAADGGVDFTVVDPDFRWPKEPPSSMYVTWTTPSPKVGGGVRVKRVVAFDGRRSFTTSYLYKDLVDGNWTSSGVAAFEPPHFGYSSDDDRVIQTEKGGWANESGGGIVHSRVVVRHTWSEDQTPAGINGVQTPMGETVVRFITSADLPHRQKDVDVVKTTDVKDANGNITASYTNSARVTEIMNMGAWWGQMLWKEDRDASGRPLNRVENDYVQLEGYLRLFPVTESGHTTGYDPDVEKAFGAPRIVDMSYTWAKKDAGGHNWPTLVTPTPGNLAAMGTDIPDASGGYLNTSVNVTVRNLTTTTRRSTRFNRSAVWKTMDQGEPPDPIDTTTGAISPTGWHSSVTAVREMNIPPLVSEVRTYGEGQKLLGVARTTKWNARTGAVMESWSRGRNTGLGDDWMIQRTWPAYWVYGGMDTGQDPASDWTNVNRDAVRNMLSQTTQVTSLRLKGDGTTAFLNSKVDTWWQPDAQNAGNWLKGGAFVWNGLGNGLKPTYFQGFTDKWTPANVGMTGLSPYKPSNWLFAGANTQYDAFGHPLEAVDGDGVYGCSKYGYPYDDTGQWNQPKRVSTDATGVMFPAGTFPIAKFGNAKDEETLYWNFEGPTVSKDVKGDASKGMPAMPLGGSASSDPDPIQRLNKAYTGERAYQGVLNVTTPSPAGSPVTQYELRYFVKVAAGTDPKGTYSMAGEVISAVPAEKAPDGQQWWLVRAKVAPGQARTITTGTGLVDDLSIFPWRRNGAPASVSHFAFDRSLGLVTSITGSNGRTVRYVYDRLGRLMKTYDVYGKAASSTRYANAGAP